MSLDLYKRERDRAVSWESGAPVAAADSGAEQAWDDAITEMMHISSSITEQRNQAEFVDDLIGKVHSATGERLQNPFDLSSGRADEYDAQGNAVSHREVAMAKFRSRIGEIRKQRPDLQLPDATPEVLAAGGKAIGDRYIAERDRASFARQNAPWTTDLAYIAGSIAGSMADPVNLAATALTLPFSAAGSIGRAALTGAAVNAASQAAVTGLNYDYRRQIDPNYTYEAALDEVLAAAAGGAILEGGAVALGRGLSRLAGGSPAATPQVPRTSPAATPAKPRAIKDAENIVSREAVKRNARPPGVKKDLTPQAQHNAAADQAMRQLELGEPVRVDAPVVERPVRATESVQAEVGEAFVTRRDAMGGEVEPRPLSPQARRIFDEMPEDLKNALYSEGSYQDGIRQARDLLDDADVQALIDAHQTDPKVAEANRFIAEAARRYAAYGTDEAVISRAMAHPDESVKALGGALTDAAPKWAALKDAIAKGEASPNLDITNDLLDATSMVMEAKARGVDIDTLLQSPDMAANSDSEIARMLARNLYGMTSVAKPATRGKIAKFLDEFATEAAKAPKSQAMGAAPDTAATALKSAGREDMLPLIEARTTEEAAEKMATSKAADIDDEIIMEANRLMAENPDLKVMVDEDGKEVSKGLFEEYERLDEEIRAAETIDACVTGKPLAENAQ